MRLKITLNLNRGRRNQLPFNYQHALGSWVYGVIEGASQSYAAFLHDKGYLDGHKAFKFFTSSELDLYPYKIKKEQGLFHLQGDTIDFQISFLMENAFEEFVKGLFLHKEGFLGNKDNKITFRVGRVESIVDPEFKNTMVYNTISPIFLSAKQGEKVLHLHPKEHENLYADYLIRNVKEKMKVFQLQNVEDDLAVDSTELYLFKLLEFKNTRLIRIRSNTNQETRNRACHMSFELTAPVEVQEVLYATGFGSLNSWSCGMVEEIPTDLLKL